MSLRCTYAIDTRERPDDLRRWLEKTFSMETVSDQPDTLTGSGLRCTIMPQTSKDQNLVSRFFGIDSTVIIRCKIGTENYDSANIEKAAQLALTLIGRDSSDLVLLKMGERGQLLRKNNQIYVDCSDPDWKEIWELAFAKARSSFSHRKLPNMYSSVYQNPDHV
ncbi:SitI3 family protein [Gimesia panareensis]|uniref:Uncharacterized protein n=1 Tax=Gimesia panareensis TaxID=2527978 RepID=A0A517ZZ81_9PLAN|nr:SitI3 family protein [Gimesia panareensis]QDT24849.1 hypothetical protein Enr10x_01410 [Gimesia panareensis]QDU47794.1 hypothetical protein Pan110_01040 [Gimesia panareensis]